MGFNFDQGIRAFRAVKSRFRINILKHLSDIDEATVLDLYVKLRIEQSECSRHLAILRSANLVKYRRSGKNIYYSLNHETLKKLIDFTNSVGPIV